VIVICAVLAAFDLFFGSMTLGFAGNGYFGYTFFACGTFQCIATLVALKSLRAAAWMWFLTFPAQWVALTLSNFAECARGNCATTSPVPIVLTSAIASPTVLLSLLAGICLWFAANRNNRANTHGDDELN